MPQQPIPAYVRDPCKVVMEQNTVGLSRCPALNSLR